MFNKKYLIELIEKNKILEFRDIVKIMKIPRNKNKDFSKFLIDLIKKGEIFSSSDRKYFVPKIIGEKEGIIRISPKGFGFVDIDDEESVFVLSSNSNSAMDGDEVKIKFFKDPLKDELLQGVVTNVIKRNRVTLVGRVAKFGNSFGLIPFDKRISSKFRFENSEGLKPNMEVKVQILKYDSKFNLVKIIKKLGMKNDISMDILTAIEDANVPLEFFDETIRESREIPDSTKNESKEGRIDLRNKMIYTIDGDDTKDFDDAISIEKLKNGNYLLGVHIADVTHYVKENSAIDKEAKMRGTSIYLADRVIPMLPESLSNGIASLNPNVDRFVLSVDMEINKKGNTVKTKIYPGIINSKYRTTYKEVNNYYDGKDIWNDKKLTDSLDLAFELSKIVRQYKTNEGYIDFEIEESKIIINDKGETVDIVPRERSYSEMMIEDFMVRANETVAKYISDMKLPFIYRVHDKPDFEKVSSLQRVIKLLGMDIKIPMSPIPIEFAKAVNLIKETRFDDFVKVMMLRTMAKAEYSQDNIGHFGLASKYYTHFTSPIRRYPDLMAHRMIREYIFNKKKDLGSHFKSILPTIAAHSSSTEQKAADLERKVADIKKAEFYEKFIGKEFSGTITSVLKFGFFVEFPNKAGGLVHVSSLTDGKYKFSNNGLAISSSEKSFVVGDKISVVVIGSSKENAKIDLIPSYLYNEFKIKNKIT